MCIRMCLACFARTFSTVDEGAQNVGDPVVDVADGSSTVPLASSTKGDTGMGVMERANFSRTEKEKKEREEEERRNARQRMPANMASFTSFPFLSCPVLFVVLSLFFYTVLKMPAVFSSGSQICWHALTPIFVY